MLVAVDVVLLRCNPESYVGRSWCRHWGALCGVVRFFSVDYLSAAVNPGRNGELTFSGVLSAGAVSVGYYYKPA